MSIMNLLGGIDSESATNRRGAIARGGQLAAAAVPVGLAAFARRGFAASASAAAPTIVEVLNFALTLEYLEARYYILGVDSGVIPGRDSRIFTTIRDHEIAHRDFLIGVIRSLSATPVPEPTFDFTAGGAFAPFANYDTFKLLAQAFEDTGVRAYKGQFPNLQSNDTVLTAAATIHSVEGRHAAEVRRLRGEKGWIPFEDPLAPAAIHAVYDGEGNLVQLGINVGAFEGAEAGTEAFDEPLTMAEVLAIASPFIVG
ncbi:MAG: ferritin-like domain-containing protein [Planctomycetes bacterium]|nr:ferritin-like domain-containing protein [Planctomycetota bacterium]